MMLDAGALIAKHRGREYVAESGVLVLTCDVELQLALQDRGVDALNFNHVRLLNDAWTMN